MICGGKKEDKWLEICTKKLACMFLIIKDLVADPGINFAYLCVDSFHSFSHVHQDCGNNICYENYDLYKSLNCLDKRMHILILQLKDKNGFFLFNINFWHK